MKKIYALALYLFICLPAIAQNFLLKTPPMGFSTWALLTDKVNEADIKSIADAMIAKGLRDAGYNYIVIDDGWQGGRDPKNNIIPDPKKFPSGMKALCDDLHGKGFKVGIYSDVDRLTCAGYNGSLNFENQDAKTFADWGIDYLKYDYCGAPKDAETAKARYAKMADAIHQSGRAMVLAICEWGDRKPWLWGGDTGAQLWRTTADIRDKWASKTEPSSPKELHKLGAGILDIVNINAELQGYAGVDNWNDPEALIVGLYGKKGPTGDLGGVGCTDTEYRSQMSLWSLMAAPLFVSCDVRTMNDVTKDILLNKDIIALNQDALGKQALREIKNTTWQVFVKALSNEEVAIGILNLSDKKQTTNINLSDVGIGDKTQGIDVWTKSEVNFSEGIQVEVDSHETKVYRLSK